MFGKGKASKEAGKAIGFEGNKELINDTQGKEREKNDAALVGGEAPILQREGSFDPNDSKAYDVLAFGSASMPGPDGREPLNINRYDFIYWEQQLKEQVAQKRKIPEGEAAKKDKKYKIQRR